MDCEVRLPSGQRLSELRVKDLQKELNKRQLSITGRKAELLARLAEFFIKEGNQGDSGGSLTSEESIVPSELTGDSKQPNEHGHEKGKKSRRRSHLRLNETFEYIEDDEDSTQRNITITPQGNSTSSLVDACHRKSSRQSKDRQSGGDAVDSSSSETIRAQTPRSSRKARRSSVIGHAEFPTDDEHGANFKDLDICSECMEKENILSSSHKVEARNNCTQLDPHGSGKRVLTDATHDQSILKIATPKQSKGHVLTPASVNKSRSGLSASTFSSVLQSAAKKSNIPSRTKSTRAVVKGLPSSSRSIKKNKGNGKWKENPLRVSPSENFARQHARLFSKMETIGDLQERVARRHEENMQAVPKAVKRLATPKSIIKHGERTQGTFTKKAGYLFDASKAKTSVTETSFNFGKVEDFSAKQKQCSSGTVVNSFSLKPSKTRDHRDVKSRTKDNSKQRSLRSVLTATVPTNNASINILATPKGMTPTRPRPKVSYTPHRGVVTFVDTTKLSDREFELAVANGLIKARSGRSSMHLEASRKSRRDDILDVKRKLKIVQ